MTRLLRFWPEVAGALLGAATAVGLSYWWLR